MIDYRKQVLSEISKSLSAIDSTQLWTMVDLVCCSGRIFCDGLGRSALAMRGFAMRLMQLGFQCYMVGETTTPALEENDLLLICTASGTSPVLLYHAQLAEKQGGKVALITGNMESPVIKLADKVILIPASNKDSIESERFSVQPMGSLFEQTSQLLCDILALEIMESLGISTDDMRRRHANIE